MGLMVCCCEDRLAKIRGRTSFQGLPDIGPGQVIELKGVGERFSGPVFVSGVHHRVADGAWTTDVQFGLCPMPFVESMAVNKPPASSLIPAIQGLHVGLVTARGVVRRMADGELAVRLPVPRDAQIAAFADDFNRMAARLQDTIEELRDEGERRRRIFADWTHEIATPLTSVLGYLESLREGGADPERTQRYLDTAYRQAKALESLTDDLSVLSRLESEGLSLDPVREDVASLVRSEVLAAGERAEGVAFHFTTEGDVVADVDAGRLGQAVRNVLDNAGRHAARTVHVECAVEGEHCVVRVKDDGPGIDPEHLPHLTDSFYRADASRARGTGGRGLGLAISRKVLEAHGGGISFESEPGHGTVVSLFVPLHEVEDGRPERPRLE